MTDVMISPKKATQYRKQIGMTQDDLGAALGKSRRLVQRVEDEVSPTAMTCLENHHYAEKLGVHPAQLWLHLPDDFIYFGRKIKSGEELARQITSKRISDFIVLGIPAEDQAAENLMKLAAAFDNHQALWKDLSPERRRAISHGARGRAQRELSEKIEIRNLYNALVGVETISEPLIFRLITTYGLEPQPEGVLSESSINLLVIDHADDRNGGSKYCIHWDVIPWVSPEDPPYEDVFRPDVSEADEAKFLERIPGFLDRRNSAVSANPGQTFANDAFMEEPE